ncbi:hypothetical protein EPO56_03715 [Patescibacteria group bacterium]|nr:MAG: hypothetical protein EPO56_03715 [Patescibacteria group bacterium]
MYTPEVLSRADEWLESKKGTLVDFCNRFSLNYSSFRVTRSQYRLGKRSGNGTRHHIAWKNEEENILQMIRDGVSVAQMALDYGIKKTTMHQRLVHMGLTPDIREEMSRGEWDEN